MWRENKQTEDSHSRLTTHFRMTCTLTFSMSTFWANSAGNLVALTRRASTPTMMIAMEMVMELMMAVVIVAMTMTIATTTTTTAATEETT